MKMDIHLIRARKRAITLVELLISMAVIVMLLLLLVQTTDMVQRTWKQTSTSVQQFSEAREALEVMTRRMSQATLNTYWDYNNPTAPTKYERQSELRFVLGQAEGKLLPKDDKKPRPVDGIFFQAPTGEVDNASYAGLQNLLNTYGYYVEWNSDEQFRPPFITNAISPARWRYRLMELMEPAENLTLYKYTSGLTGVAASKNAEYASDNPNGKGWYSTGREWYREPVSPTQANALPKTRVVAENILYIKIIPYEGVQIDLSDATYYDTSAWRTSPIALKQKAQLPPFLRVSMLAVDEAAFSRYQGMAGGTDGSTPPDWMNSTFLRTTNDDTLDQQVDQLEARLAALKIPFRRFSTQIALRGAKWSK